MADEKKREPKLTLEDKDIVTERRLSRRSLLSATGAVLGAAAALTASALTGTARAGDPAGKGTDTD